MNTTKDLNLYDLMADDHTVWVGKNEKLGFDLNIVRDFDSAVMVNEEGIHPYAMEAFAVFCRDFLHLYEKLDK